MPRALADDLDHVLDHTHDLWEELRGQRIFITGGTGFFGCWLLESFAWANERLHLGAKATVLTRDPAKFSVKASHLAETASVELLPGDVRNFAFPSGNFSHVIHAATDSAVVPAVAEVVDTVVGGTERCLELAERAGTQKLLFTSSGAVYGKQPPGVSHMAEDWPEMPGLKSAPADYGEAKLLAEQKCIQAARSSDIEAKIARCFAFVGPYMNLNVHFAIGNFLRDQMRGGPIVISGDGTPLRSYLYASDLAIWLWTMLFRAPSGVAYNVGSEEAVSIAELARAVARVATPEVEVQVLGKPSGAPAARYVPSTQKAQKELGLRQYVSLPEAIAKTRNWYLVQPH